MTELQLSCLNSWKMMLWKCCIQCYSKFGKLSSGHRTGKGQFSFQFQRKAIQKNAQTTTQLHSSHMLVKSCSKFSKRGFNSTWTKNFQMFKLVLEKAEESEIKLQHTLDHRKAREFQRNMYFCLTDYAKAFDCVDHNKLWKTLKEMGTPDHLICLQRNLYGGQEARVRILYGTADWFRIEKRVWQGCYCQCIYLTYTQSTSCEIPGWMSYKLESRLPGELSTTSDMWMIPP